MTNEVVREHWQRAIAHALDMREDVIASHVRRRITRDRRFTAHNQTQSPSSREDGHVDMSMLTRKDHIIFRFCARILTNPSLWKTITQKENTTGGFFDIPLLAFLRQTGPQDGYSFEAVQHHVPDTINEDFKRARAFVSFDEGDLTDEEIQKYIDDTIASYTLEERKERRNHILQDIQEAEQHGDKTAVRFLLEELQKLSN
jgi:hypothetical protein